MKILITHTDADGIGCAILSRIAYPEQLVIFSNNWEVDEVIRETILSDDGSIEALTVTDLPIKEETQIILNEWKEEKRNVSLIYIDHHKSTVVNYDWMNVDPVSSISATKMYYNHLNQLGLIISHRSVISELCNDISRYDTWEWKNDPVDYREDTTALLLNYYGDCEETTSIIVENILTLDTPFSNEELIIADTLRNVTANAVTRYSKQFHTIKLWNYVVALLNITNVNPSELGNKICLENEDIDLVAMISPINMGIGLRSTKENVDVSKIAESLGGGGHKHAAGAKLSAEMYRNLIALCTERVLIKNKCSQ